MFPSPQIDHPFVVNMRYAFQDDENCFFVLDLMLGGDLRCELSLFGSAAWCLTDDDRMLKVHLERLGSLSEEVVRFYIAEVGSALAFLHDHRIIHR